MICLLQQSPETGGGQQIAPSLCVGALCCLSQQLLGLWVATLAQTHQPQQAQTFWVLGAQLQGFVNPRLRLHQVVGIQCLLCSRQGEQCGIAGIAQQTQHGAVVRIALQISLQALLGGDAGR